MMSRQLHLGKECNEKRHTKIDDKSVEYRNDNEVLATGAGKDG